MVVMFDEDCSGIISQAEYFKTLQAYNACDEKHSNQQKRQYEQEILLKYIAVLKEKELKPE
jgi:Ca2+-binding EF-hand superfamily protein